MYSSRIMGSLKGLLEALEKERESLRSIMLSGRISRETFDLLERRINRTISLASELEDALRDDEAFWTRSLQDGVRILEGILLELELKRLLGEVGEEEYQRSSGVITEGISMIMGQLRRDEAASMRAELDSDQSGGGDPPGEAENDVEEPHGGSGNPVGRRGESREGVMNDAWGVSAVCCMNPWNPDCRNTDIEVSIYYHGRMVPICRRCWEEIANKDVEWSSL